MSKKLTYTLILLFIAFYCSANSAHFEEGMNWKNKGNFVEALKHFELAKNEQPENKNVLIEFANAAFELQKYAQAIPVYEELLVANKKDLTALTRLAKMYSYSSEKFKSIEYADRAIKLKPTNDEHNIMLGDAYYFVKHYPKAIEQYNKITPATEYTISKTAHAYAKMSAHNSAIQYFEKLIALQPESKASLYYEYGNSLFSAGRYRLATKAYLTAKEKGFYNLMTINQNIAMGFVALEAFEPALEFFLEAKKASPFDKGINLNIADCYNKLGNYKMARAVIEELQATRPGDGELVYAYGMTYYKEGKTAKAETYFNKAFEMNPALKSLRYTKSNF